MCVCVYVYICVNMIVNLCVCGYVCILQYIRKDPLVHIYEFFHNK